MAFKFNKDKSIPRRFLYLFISVGFIFIAQMVWWIYFFLNQLKGLPARYVRMLITEGIFFVVLIIFGLAIIYRVLRQQVLLKQQFKDFFAGFSHELKTPLAAMKLQTETLISLKLDREKQLHLLENMLEDQERLELAIENILDVFRYESGKLTMQTVPTDLDVWLEKSLESSARAYREQGLDLDVDLNCSGTVNLDDRYFYTVIANIVQNSVRYAQDKPQLRIATSCNDDGAVITFSDAGIGIDPSDVEQIFEKYFRIDEKSKIRHKGTGLGLFLSRQIVLAHDGTIRAESEGYGKGTNFIITLPMRQ